MAWRVSDISPKARRAAEDAADAAGKPLVDWLAATVSAAVIREIGAIPGFQPPPAPKEQEKPTEAPPLATSPSANAPAEKPRTIEINPRLPAIGGYRSRRLSPESKRVADSGLTGWLEGRIEGLPARREPPPPAESPPPPKPQLELFPKAAAPEETPAQARATIADAPPLALPSGPVVPLPVAALRPSRARARRAGGDDGVPALAASVAVQGVREPLLVRKLAGEPGVYEVIAGDRRRIAAERAGRTEVPAIIVEANDAEALMLSLTENLGRRDFSPLDEARAYLRLLTEYRVSPSLLARRLARERTHIATALRLLGLPERVRHYLDSGQLSPAQAYKLLGAPDAEALAEQMVRGDAPPAEADAS